MPIDGVINVTTRCTWTVWPNKLGDAHGQSDGTAFNQPLAFSIWCSMTCHILNHSFKSTQCNMKQIQIKYFHIGHSLNSIIIVSLQCLATNLHSKYMIPKNINSEFQIHHICNLENIQSQSGCFDITLIVRSSPNSQYWYFVNSIVNPLSLPYCINWCITPIHNITKFCSHVASTGITLLTLME